MSEVERWLTLLEEKGGRLTGPRKVIVELMVNSERALSPIDVFDQARIEYPKMGLVTVYRTLEFLHELGLVERVHQTDGCHMYLRSAHGHEHIMLCSRCGRAVYFSGDDISSLIQRVSNDSGFLVQEHWLQLSGLCKSCH